MGGSISTSSTHNARIVSITHNDFPQKNTFPRSGEITLAYDNGTETKIVGNLDDYERLSNENGLPQ